MSDHRDGPESADVQRSVAIVGAGPAGLTAAYMLAKRGIPVCVYESGPSVGGLARSFSLWGQTVDVGPHRFFSTDTRVNQLWLELVGSDYSMVKRLTRILYRSRLFLYPLQPANALRNLGAMTSCACVASYVKQKLLPIEDAGTFESWVIRRFGRRLYEIFFKTYSEKLWGIPCHELDADFAAQRIKKLSLWEAIKNAAGGRTGQHKTLVDEFAYPHGGTGSVYERMGELTRLRGGTIRLGTPVHKVLLSAGKAIGVQTADGSTCLHSHVVSTMPLTLLVKSLEGAPEDVTQAASSLTFRNTIIVYLRVDSASLFPDNWLYVHSPELATGRITNFRNWVPQIFNGSRDTIVAMELWCYPHDAVWQEDDKMLIARASADLRRTGLLGNANIGDGQVVRVPRCYPVYRRGYKDHVDRIRMHLDGIENLQVIGRYGAFKYNNQDHSILMGILAAENIAQRKNHDLWSINTDYDDYQERSLITATGLAPHGAMDRG